MSRTIRGSKAVGYGVLGSRPLNKNGGLVGKFTKTFTSRIERRNSKKLVAKELNELQEDTE